MGLYPHYRSLPAKGSVSEGMNSRYSLGHVLNRTAMTKQTHTRESHLIVPPEGFPGLPRLPLLPPCQTRFYPRQ